MDVITPPASRARAPAGVHLLSLVLLSLVLLLSGCATSTPRGNWTGGTGPSSRTPSRLVPGAAMGGAGDAPEDTVDLFQGVQEASGLAAEAWHPAGTALFLAQAEQLLGELARTPVTHRGFAPRRVLCWLLREALAGGERVEYGDLTWRTERFGPLVLVRPDGYLVTALTGTPLQRLGTLRLVEGEWRVGSLTVGNFYFSRGGVFYPVNEALRRVDGPPLGELGLGKDPFNAALDGAQEALGEMAVALAHVLLHPIRTVEDLAQLPTSLARLIASSPEYFARYGAMSREDQVREAARLSTHVLTLLGGAEATVGRLGGLGAELPVLSLTATGELVLGGAVTGGAATPLGLGALSILHMAGSGPGNAGGSGGKTGPSAQASAATGPGKWTYKKPTTESQRALDYQEQVTGRPAWYVYMVGKVEFDGFNGKQLLEAKGSNYKHFLEKDGTAKPWFRSGEGLAGLLDQATRQSDVARTLKMRLVWHVAEAEFANFLHLFFEENGLDNITVQHTPPAR